MKKLKYLLTEIFEKSNMQASEDDSEGSVPFYTSSQELTKYCNKAIYPGNAITMGTGGSASINYSEVPFSTSTDCLNFKCRDKDLTKFIYYSILGQLDIVNDLGFKGMGLKHLQKDFLFSMPIKNELNIKEINMFLDKKCSSIDGIIESEENSISSLNSYKFSLISKTVTEGLQNNEKIRTGNKWFKEIPCGWQIKKIKYILSLDNGIRVGPFGSSLSGKVLYDKSDVKIYGQWNVIAKDFTIDRNFINYDSYKTLKQYEVLPGDILISMMGTIGRCLTVPSGIEKGIMDSHIIKIRLNNLVNPRYFEYFYDKTYSNCCIRQLDFLKKGSIMDGLNSSILKEIFICIPPYEEQEKIADFLDKKCLKIDEIIKIKKEKIETLKKYKKSLIYECVTGKKEIQYAK